jgi:hypothetical protein
VVEYPVRIREERANPHRHDRWLGWFRPSEHEIGEDRQVIGRMRRLRATQRARMVEDLGRPFDVVLTHANGDENLVKQNGTGMLVGAARQVIALPTRRVESIHLLADDVDRTLAVTDIARGHEGFGRIRQKRPIDLFGTTGGIGIARLQDVERAVIGIVVEVADEDKISVVEVAFEDAEHGTRRPFAAGIGGGPSPRARLSVVHYDHKRRGLV